MHVHEKRIVRSSEPARWIRYRWNTPGRLHRIDVGAIVHTGDQLILRRNQRAEHGQFPIQAERTDQAHRQLHADRCERVPGTEVVFGEGFVPDE